MGHIIAFSSKSKKVWVIIRHSEDIKVVIATSNHIVQINWKSFHKDRVHLIGTLKNLNFYDTGARNGNSFQAKHPKLVATSLGSGRPLLSVQNGPERKVARALQSRASSGKEAGRSALGANTISLLGGCEWACSSKLVAQGLRWLAAALTATSRTKKRAG